MSAARRKQPRTTPPPVPKIRKRCRRRPARFGHIFGLGALILISLFCSIFILTRPPRASHDLSHDQLKTEVAAAASRYGLDDHLDELFAIVQVESNWKMDDVFQSSESLGLAPNTLGVYESIDQGCSYYKSLLEKGQELGVDQDAIYQAYNFGPGYLDFVAANGGIHTPALAEEFSREYSQGRIVSYPNPIAIAANGGWRYDYGNMFYVQLIHQALSSS